MSKYKNKEIGKRGEKLAISYLKKRGYRILDKNFRCKIGEIDIVAENDGQIVFVEVKTRHNFNFGLPEEALNYFKRKRLSRLALFYLSNHHLQKKPCRFDVVAILLEKEKPRDIHLIKNAFEAMF